MSSTSRQADPKTIPRIATKTIGDAIGDAGSRARRGFALAGNSLPCKILDGETGEAQGHGACLARRYRQPPAMHEILPGLFHWSARHPIIHVEVSSYWLAEEGVAIDPLVPPEEGLHWFASREPAPSAVLLSNRHHYRHAGLFAERFHCPVFCNRLGLYEFGAEQHVQGFDVGQQLPGPATAHEMGAICPDDTALFLPHHHALLIADGVVRGGPHGQDGPLGFVPDSLMDDPPATKQRLLASCRRLLDELDFQHLLLAHGGPVLGDGRSLLLDLVESGGRTAFEM